MQLLLEIKDGLDPLQDTDSEVNVMPSFCLTEIR